MISTRRRMPDREGDKPIRPKELWDREVMNLVEVEDGRAAVEVEAVEEAAVMAIMVEEVVAIMVVAEEVRISSATVVETRPHPP